MTDVQFDPDIIEGLKRRRRLPLPRPGERHGKLTVGAEFGFVVSGFPRLTVACCCDCGNGHHQYVQYLQTGKAKSCGCAAGDTLRARSAAMPYKRTLDPIYQVWRGMIQRTEDVNCDAYRNYGARGIAICSAWRSDFDVFRAWAAGGYAPGLSIERRDVNGNYEPSNCCWATDKEQANNTTRSATLTAFGETKTVAMWADDARCCVKAGALYFRYEAGWDHEAALTTPRKQERGPSVEAFGETRTIKAWAKDPRCPVTYKVLWQRLKMNQFDTPEEAITSLPFGRPRTTERTSRSNRPERSPERRPG